jgi:hypothetical protein
MTEQIFNRLDSKSRLEGGSSTVANDLAQPICQGAHVPIFPRFAGQEQYLGSAGGFTLIRQATHLGGNLPSLLQTVWKTIHPNLKGVNRVLKLRYLRQRPKLWQQGLPLNAQDPPSLESKYPTHPYFSWRNSKASECLCFLPEGWKSYSLI